jgi:polysaccharide deacetylase 2 family uncharacterized protein YibQ
MARKKRASPKSARRKHPKSRRYFYLVLLLLAAAAAGFYLLHERLNRSGRPGKPAPVRPGLPVRPGTSAGKKGARLLLSTRSELKKNASIFASGIAFSDCSTSEQLNCLQISVASDSDFILAQKAIEGLWEEQGFEITRVAKKNSPSFDAMLALKDGKQVAELDLRILEKALPRPDSRHSGRRKIAIVIDDLGKNLEAASALASIPQPVTLSILPFQEHSAETLELARKFGKPALLHMPMQPEDYPATDPGKNALLCNMSEKEITANLQAALDSLPGVIGVNNHMGSAFTARAELVRPVLSEIARRNLFFLDSKTSRNDLAFELARQMQIRTCQRGIFLDNLPDEEDIWLKLNELCWNEHDGRSRIAIGHPYPETLRVLRERLGELELSGCEVVPVQEFCP